MYIEGIISREEIRLFREECEKLGWIVISESSVELTYLDRRCNKHILEVGEKTGYVILG